MSEKLSKSVTEIAEIENLKGLDFLNRKLFSKSIKCFKRAIKINPNYVDAYNNLGVLNKNIGKYDEAIKNYSIAISKNPKYAGAYYNLGNIYRELNNTKRAIINYRATINNNPCYSAAIIKLADIYRDTNDFDSAIILYKSFLELKPRSFDAYNSLGSIFFKKDMLDEAIDYYEKAISLNPNYFQAINNLGLAFRKKGMLENALILYKKAINLEPNSIKVMNNIAFVLKQKGEIDNSIKIYKKILEIEPKYFEALISLHNLYLQTGKSFSNLSKRQKCHEELKCFPKYWIQNAILNYIREDFRSLENSLKQFCISRKRRASYSILTDEEKQFCEAYYVFLNKLLNGINYKKLPSRLKVYHIGESHCLSYANRLIEIKDRRYKIIPRIVFGTKAFHLSNSEENEFKVLVSKNIDSLPKNSIVFMSFGEIDCRLNEGFLMASEKKKTNLEVLISNTVKGYISWICEAIRIRNHKVYIFNVPAPIFRTQLSRSTNYSLRMVVEIFNKYLRKEISGSNLLEIDIYSLTSNSRGFSNLKYHCDGYHLDSRCLKLIEEQL